jgi:hypothetical protein
MASNPGNHNRDMLYMEYLVSLAAPEAMKTARAALNVWLILCEWLATPITVLIRYKFGEREFTPIRFVCGWLTMRAFMAAVWVSGSATHAAGEVFSSRRTTPVIPNLSEALVALFVIVSLIHLAQIWDRNRRKVQWHSYCFGISWLSYFQVDELLTALLKRLYLPIVCDDWFLYRIIEPALCLLVSQVIGSFDVVTSVYLTAASVALFILNNQEYHRERARVLDIQDAQIEVRYYAAAVQGKPKQQAAGLPVMPGAHDLFIRRDTDIQNAIAVAIHDTRVSWDDVTDAPSAEDASYTPNVPLRDYAATVDDVLRSASKNDHSDHRFT